MLSLLIAPHSWVEAKNTRSKVSDQEDSLVHIRKHMMNALFAFTYPTSIQTETVPMDTPAIVLSSNTICCTVPCNLMHTITPPYRLLSIIMTVTIVISAKVRYTITLFVQLTAHIANTLVITHTLYTINLKLRHYKTPSRCLQNTKIPRETRNNMDCA